MGSPSGPPGWTGSRVSPFILPEHYHLTSSICLARILWLTWLRFLFTTQILNLFFVSDTWSCLFPIFKLGIVAKPPLGLCSISISVWMGVVGSVHYIDQSSGLGHEQQIEVDWFEAFGVKLGRVGTDRDWESSLSSCRCSGGLEGGLGREMVLDQCLRS